MSTLNSKTTQFNIIIQLQDINVSKVCEKLNKYLYNLVCNYAYILHDKDINADRGVLKNKHLHLIIYNAKQKRLSTIINEISGALDINVFAITVDKVVSLEGSIQYLIHKNDAEKYHYDVKDIITNIDKTELDLLLNTENGSLTFDRLFQIIRSAKNKTDVIKIIGLSYYRAYRPVINDIWNDYKG